MDSQVTPASSANGTGPSLPPAKPAKVTRTRAATEPANAVAAPTPAPDAPPASLPSGRMILWQLSQVMADFAKVGLSKSRENREQGFKFRGIDELMNLAAPIFVRHRILVTPEVLDRVLVERETARGSIMFNVALRVKWTFTSALDGSSHVAITAGEAQDSGDKATNKAQSAAFKYVLLQSFCIPLEGEGEDADSNTPEESVAQRKPEPKPAGYAAVVKGAEEAAKQGTDFLKAYARTVNRDCWTYLVERDPKVYDVIKGAALDVDAKAKEQK